MLLFIVPLLLVLKSYNSSLHGYVPPKSQERVVAEIKHRHKKDEMKRSVSGRFTQPSMRSSAELSYSDILGSTDGPHKLTATSPASEVDTTQNPLFSRDCTTSRAVAKGEPMIQPTAKA